MTNYLPMKYLIWILIIALVVLHQDIWYWDDTTLVFGFMPITLLYHAGISLAAGFTWYLATIFAWPADLQTDQPRQGDGDPPA